MLSRLTFEIGAFQIQAIVRTEHKFSRLQNANQFTNEDASLLWCDTVALSEYFQTYRMISIFIDKKSHSFLD